MKNYSKNQKRDEIFTFQNLLKCYYQCRKRKRYTIDAAKFEFAQRQIEEIGKMIGSWLKWAGQIKK